jgi:hypothetical protein
MVVGALERSGLIENRRGRIHLLNLKNLENIACECYKVLRSLATAPQLASGANGSASAVEILGAM